MKIENWERDKFCRKSHTVKEFFPFNEKTQRIILTQPSATLDAGHESSSWRFCWLRKTSRERGGIYSHERARCHHVAKFWWIQGVFGSE